QVRQQGPDPTFQLISLEELHEIRRIWRFDRHDTEDAVPRIVQEVMGQDFEWPEDDLGALTPEDHHVLTQIANEYDLPPLLLRKLRSIELQYQGMMRRAGIFEHIRRVLYEAWHSDAHVTGLSVINGELATKGD